jgi:hypothetical protein
VRLSTCNCLPSIGFRHWQSCCSALQWISLLLLLLLLLQDRRLWLHNHSLHMLPLLRRLQQLLRLLAGLQPLLLLLLFLGRGRLL